MGEGRMGRFGQQSPGPILHAYRSRAKAAYPRAPGIRSHDRRDPEGLRIRMKILRRIRYVFRQRQMERELAEEIEFHRDVSGEPGGMGNLTRAREDARAVWIWPWLQSVWQDVAYAMRSLRSQPGFTLIALLALG